MAYSSFICMLISEKFISLYPLYFINIFATKNYLIRGLIMEGIGLDNMMGAEEVEKFFGGNQEPDNTGETTAGVETPASEEHIETEETAEVDFSDLLGNNQPESVGSEKNTEGNGGAPESQDGQGSPQVNLFSSIAKATKDEGVFPDLSDEELDSVKDAETLRKLFDAQVKKMFDESQRKLLDALNGGATNDEMKEYLKTGVMPKHQKSEGAGTFVGSNVDYFAPKTNVVAPATAPTKTETQPTWTPPAPPIKTAPESTWTYESATPAYTQATPVAPTKTVVEAVKEVTPTVEQSTFTAPDDNFVLPF